MPVRRQLEQNRPGVILQSFDSRKETSQSLLRILKALDVSQIAAGFDRIEEIGRRLLAPGGERFLLRQMVKGVVDLDGVEELEIVIEPVLHRQFRRIENIPPVLIHPTGRADVNLAG